MAVAKYKIVRKCPVCGEEFFARTLESWYCSPKCSKVAWKRKHDEEKRQLELDKIVSNMPKSKEYLSDSDSGSDDEVSTTCLRLDVSDLVLSVSSCVCY